MLVAVKDASRRGWPSAILDRGCARRQRSIGRGKETAPSRTKKRTEGLTPPAGIRERVIIGIITRRGEIWPGGRVEQSGADFGSLTASRLLRLITADRHQFGLTDKQKLRDLEGTETN